MTILLLAARLRMAINRLRHRKMGWRRPLATAVFAVVFAGGVWWSAHWFFSKCLEIEPIGEVIIRRSLGMTLLAAFSLLGFSSLISAFSSLYLADDLQLLVSRPVRPNALYGARFTETAIAASWMIVPFSLPIFVAAGQLLGAGAGYYLDLAAVYFALAVIPTSLAVGLSLALTSVLSARRARHIFVIAGSLVLGVLVFVLRRLRPEELMHPDESAPMIEALQALQGLDPSWLPSSWALDALWPHLGYGARPDTHPVALLLTASAASFFVTGWMFRALHGRAFSRAQEGMTRGAGDRRARRGTRPLAVLVARDSVGTGCRQFPRELRRKDRLVFLRDTAQWSQLLILAAVVAIYILNFRYIQVVTGSGLVSDIGLHFLNLAVGGFVVMALAARFVFPAVSLEGRAFWLVLASPNSTLEYLRAKSASWTIALTGFAALLLVATQTLLGTDPLLAAASVLTVIPLVAGLTALGVGLGARLPRFDADSAAAVATGLGGVLYMLNGVALLVAVVLLSILPTITAVRMIRRPYTPSPTMILLSVLCSLLVVALPLVAGRTALRVGARHLKGGDEIAG